MTALRIFLVAGPMPIAEGLAVRLEGLGYSIAGCAATVEQARASIPVLVPDLVVVDAGRNATGVAEAGDGLGAAFGLPVVRVTDFRDAPSIARAVEGGPLGYLVAPFENRELDATLQAAFYRHLAERLPRAEAQRQADRLRRGAPAARVGYWELAVPDLTLTWSPELYRLRARDPARVTTLADALTSYPPEVRSLVAAAVDDALRDGRPWDLELPMSTADGGRIWVRSRGEAVREDGAIVRLVGTVEDITEARAAAQAMADKERLLTLLMNTTREGYWFIDGETRTIDLNPAMCALLGRPRDAVMGRTIYEFVDEENAAIFRRELAARRAGKTGGYQIALRRPDGRLVHCFNNATPIRDEDGRQTGSIGLWTDITGMVEQGHVLQTMLRALPDGVVVSDADSRTLAVNDAFYAVAGVERREGDATDPVQTVMRALAVRGEYGPGDPDELVRRRRAEIRRLIGTRGQIRYDRRIGEDRWVEFRMHAMPGGGLLGLLRDVSDERRHLTEQARQSRLLDTLLDSIVEGISVFDTELRLVAGNRRWAELTGVDPALMRPGTALRDILIAQLRAGELGPCENPEAEADRRIQANFLQTAEPWVSERVRPNGRIIERRRSPMVGGGFITIYVDITERKATEGALARSNQLLESIFESFPAIVFLKRAEDLRYERFNRDGLALFAHTGETVVGRDDFEIFGPEQAAAFRRSDLAALAAPGRIEDAEKPFRAPGGAERWIRTSKIALRDADGRPTYVLGVSLDVTESREAQDAVRRLNQTLAERVAERTAALAASEERLRRIIDTALDGVFTTDAAGRIAAWNPQAEAMFGWRADEAIGRPLADVIVPAEGRSRLEGRFERLAQSGDHAGPDRRVELRARRRDGTPIDVALRMTSFTLDGARWFSGFVSDITARKAAEAELHVTRLNLQDAIESLETGVILYDRDTRVVVFNETALNHYPELRDTIRVGTTFETIIRTLVERGGLTVPPGADPEAWIAARVARHRAAELEPQPYVLRDGRILEVTKRRSRAGGVLATGLDVTERRAMEQQLREAQRMEAIGKLTGGMAHDFNNYLSTIVGNLELAGDAPELSDDTRELIEQALSGAFSAAELTRSLLAFARRQALDPRPTDVNQRVAAIAGLLARTLGEDVELTTRLAPDLWRVRIDGAQLDSCIVNLANNARDAMPRGGRLTIATRNVPGDETSADAADGLAGDHVLIEIADSGVGMAPEVLANAFEPFFTTKGPGHGTGLGLSMVYGFVRQSGGQIRIESAPGAGTVVRVRLPRDRSAETGEAAAAAGAPALPRGDESVLVVEDNAQLRRTVSVQLGGLGYRVVQASNGPEALAVLEDPARRIDLLFTDVVMPGGLDGHALAVQARARRPGLRVLLTSGYVGERSGAPGLEAVRLLGKPYHKAELAQAVRAALDGAPAAERHG